MFGLIFYCKIVVTPPIPPPCSASYLRRPTIDHIPADDVNMSIDYNCKSFFDFCVYQVSEI